MKLLKLFSRKQETPKKSMRPPIPIVLKGTPNSDEFGEVRPGEEFQLQYVLAHFKLGFKKIEILIRGAFIRGK